MTKLLNFIYRLTVLSAVLSSPSYANPSGKATFQGNPVELLGNFPTSGQPSKAFTLVDKDLKDVTLDAWKGKRKVINIFVSADTPVCDASLRRFNELAASMSNTVVLGISKDLPFAQQRLCASAGIQNVVMLSAFRSATFGRDYGVEVKNGPLQGLFARAIVVVDETDRVIYSQLVAEITNEPDYDRVLRALK